MCYDIDTWPKHLSPNLDVPYILWSASPLHIAAWFGDIQIARVLLDQGASVDVVDDLQRTPLHFAAFEGHTDMINFLHQVGSAPNALDIEQASPSNYAAQEGHVDAFLALIKCGADLRIVDCFRTSALHHMAYSDILHRIFNHTATLCELGPASEDSSGESVLCAAIARGGPHQTSFMLNLPPEIEAYEPNQGNVLTAAVQNSAQNMVYSPLKRILRRLPESLIPKLLAHRALCGGTPLYAACTVASSRWEHSAITTLLAAGADLELEGGHAGTPLMGACVSGRLFAVKLLVSKGAKICYTKDDRTVSALHAARNFPKILRWLLVGRFTEHPRLLTNKGEHST